MTDPLEYLVTECTKTVGRILDGLDKVRTNFERTNIETIAERSPEILPALHTALVSIETNGVRALMLTAEVTSALSAEIDEAKTDPADGFA